MNRLTRALMAFVISIHPLAAYAVGGQDQTKKSEQDDTVRLKSDLVQVRAVITDKQGQLVSDLKREDFEILENNRPQEISFFSVETINKPDPAKPADPRTLRARAEQPARSIVLFVDTIHMSFASLERVKYTLKKFVDEQMTDRDLVALVTSSGSLGLMEQFTRDRVMLRSAIDRLRVWQLEVQESLFTPYVAAQISRGDHRYMDFGVEIMREEFGIEHMPDQMLESLVRGKATQVLAEAAYRRKATISTLQGVVERVTEMQGQRLIFLFSDGFTVSGIGGSSDSPHLQPAITRAVRSGVVIYSLGAQGLQAHVLPPSYAGFMEHEQRTGRPGYSRPKFERPALTFLMSDSDKDLHEGMTALARDTGGEAYFDTNDVSGKLQKVLNDNRIYYALSYQAQNYDSSDKGNQFRSITLRVKHHPEYKVRTQRGYQPLEAKLEQQNLTPRQRLGQAMAAGLPATTIPVSVSADHFERDDGQVYIQIFIDANAFQYRAQDQNNLFSVETVIMIYDLTGKRAHISTNQADGNFTAERLELAKRNGYRYTERVSLKPGIYQARVGVLETATERIGTATAWVQVPDINKGKMALSSLLLTKEASAGQQAPNKAAEVESLSPSVTQGIRVCKQGDELGYHLVIYPGSGKGQKTDGLLMRIEVGQGEQQIYQSQWDSVESYAVGKDSKGMEVGGQLKLKGIKPGVYELRIAVKNPKSKKPLERVALFGVEP